MTGPRWARRGPVGPLLQRAYVWVDLLPFRLLRRGRP